MDRIWIWLVRVLFQISFFIGVCHFRRGKYLVFDGFIFCISIVWFGGCTVRMETDSLLLGGIYYTFKFFVIFWSLFVVNIVLFLSLIDFRLKNSQSFKLISLYHELNVIHSQIPSHGSGRRLLNVFGVMIFHVLSGVCFLYWEETASSVVNKTYDRLCVTTITWPTTILCFQFSCWVQIFTFNFELILEKIRSTIASAKRTNAKCLSDCALSKLMSELKMVMRLKRAITDSYGSSILLNQLYTFICVVLNCILFTHVEYAVMKRKNYLGWFRYYFMARILYYSMLSYIPHWIGQITFSKVKKLLYEIRKLLITDHSTAFDEKVSHYLFNPVYNDLKFRVCNLFDLTNKQFVSFLSISIGFAIIQMQFFMA